MFGTCLANISSWEVVDVRSLTTRIPRLIRRHWILIVLTCVGVMWTSAVPSLVAVDEPAGLGRPEMAQAAESEAANTTAVNAAYDRFLKGFERLKSRADRRHRLASEITQAARKHHIDADLLFAVIAVESRFDPNAVSSGGAHGLGQVLFSTAKAVAPHAVHRPSDLHNVRQNLDVTARYLKQLLDEWDGDVRDALLAYHAGPEGPKERGPNPYVERVQTYIAAIKEDRNEAAG